MTLKLSQIFYGVPSDTYYPSFPRISVLLRLVYILQCTRKGADSLSFVSPKVAPHLKLVFSSCPTDLSQISVHTHW